MASQFHRLSGQFRDEGTERDFRTSILANVQRDSRLVLLATAMIAGLFSISDYSFLGLSRPFYLLIGVRASLVLGCLVLSVVLRSSNALLMRPWLYSIAPVLLSTTAIAIVAFRPQSLPLQFSGAIVMLMGIYLLIPNLIWGMVASGLYLSFGFLFAIWFWGGMTPVAVVAPTVLLILGNAVGYGAALRLARLQREQFALLRDERRSKHVLMEEVARRETLETRLRDMAQRDELSGLSNRRHFLECAKAALVISRLQKRPFSLCILDIDNFKTINDSWGHGCGDKVLRAIAETCVLTLRTGEPIGRFGGDEFVAALPGASLDNAFVIAERLREKIAELRFDDELTELRITATIGLSEVCPQEAELDRAFERADAALYMGKRRGRNVVIRDGLVRAVDLEDAPK